jgi:exodeoxyribonuclease VII large subunit
MPTPESTSRDIYSISRLNTEVRAVLEGSFPLVWVEGEISNLAMPRSGHLYFSLKDANAQVRCALFRNRRQLLRFQPGNGDQVLARARVGFYEPRGDFQLIIEHLEPAGAGSAQRAFEALKQKLHAEGLFASERKRELPPFPRRIGVITSPSGAAIRDVLNVLQRRAPQIAVTIFPAQVQGQDAPTDLVEALQVALARRDCDLLLLTRGGGSAEDLAAFNDERLARLIADAEIPIVSAVGHEIDFTIADFVADRRAPTPSAAAELISPDGDALRQRLMALAGRLAGAARRRLDERARHLALASGRLQRLSPRNRLRQQEQRLDELDLRLARAMRGDMAIRHQNLQTLQHRLEAQSPRQRLALLTQRFTIASSRLGSAMQAGLEQRRRQLSATGRELNAVSPLATLQRGYSVLREPSTGGVIGSVEDLKPGDKLEAMLADGRVEMTAGKIFKTR